MLDGVRAVSVHLTIARNSRKAAQGWITAPKDSALYDFVTEHLYAMVVCTYIPRAEIDALLLPGVSARVAA